MSDYDITLEQGVTYTTAWRTAHPDLVKGFKIDKAEITELFDAEPDAVAMRVYLGLIGDTPNLVLVGVDSEGRDLLSKVCDHVTPCPDTCDESSVLCVGE